MYIDLPENLEIEKLNKTVKTKQKKCRDFQQYLETGSRKQP